MKDAGVVNGCGLGAIFAALSVLLQRIAGCFLLFLLSGPLGCSAEEIRDGRLIQADLDAGRDVVLQPGEVFEVTESLHFRKAGQRISTAGARTSSEYARIVMAPGAKGTLIDAKGIAGATLFKVVLDGNRQGFRHPEGLLMDEPMLSFGGEGATGQEIHQCIVIGSRCSGGWAAIHVQEGGKDIVIRDNLVFASGTDIRGNGRSAYEKPFGWGDGISTASRDTLVVNNLIYDATDEGIMVQGAPGTQVKSNVVVALSREMLGGIALIDPFQCYVLDAAAKTVDYRGVVVEDNLILATGSRIHAGIPLGGAVWTAGFKGATLVGACIQNNRIGGEAAGYGVAVNGVDDFDVQGNISDATYSGAGDGIAGTPVDSPGAFLFDPSAVGSSRLQPEFAVMTNSLVHVLRSNRVPSDPLGYRDVSYPDEESAAIVRFAFVEMLGREPDQGECTHWKKWLQETRSNGDTLRRSLMTSPEFIRLHGYINPLALHVWRNERWLKMILKTCSELQSVGNEWPDAFEVHVKLIEVLRSSEK